VLAFYVDQFEFDVHTVRGTERPARSPAGTPTGLRPHLTGGSGDARSAVDGSAVASWSGVQLAAQAGEDDGESFVEFGSAVVGG
jgi:hypothetical protein